MFFGLFASKIPISYETIKISCRKLGFNDANLVDFDRDRQRLRIALP